MWNHVGSCFLSFQESLSGARARLAFFVVLKRVTMRGGGRRRDWLFGPGRVGGRSEVRNMLTLFRHCIPDGRMQLMMVSVTKAQVGRRGDVSRYFFSQIVSMVRLRVLRSSNAMPPSLRGFWSRCRLIGEDFWPFQRKRHIV